MTCIILSNTFIAEIFYPAWYATIVTQSIDVIASIACVDAFLKTVLSKKSRFATWGKRIKTYIIVKITTYSLHVFCYEAQLRLAFGGGPYFDKL